MDEQEKSKFNYFLFYIFALIEAIFRGRKNELEKTKLTIIFDFKLLIIYGWG